MNWIDENGVIRLHDMIIESYGGAPGIRDHASLEAAVSQPLLTFGGNSLYPDRFTKIARAGFNILCGHPFTDGNKRTALMTVITLLEANGFRTPGEDGLADLMVRCAEKGQFSRFEQGLKNLC